MMPQYIKIVIIYFLRIVLRVFYIIPVNENKILFNSHKGYQYSCNPKYIFEYLYEKYGDKFEYIWCLNDKEKLPFEFRSLVTVKYLSLQYYYNLLTTKYYIFNDGISPVFPLRNQQLVVNTWHGGGAYKKAGIESVTFNSKLLEFVWDVRSKMTKHIVSSCKAFTDYTSKDFLCEKSKFFSVGMPRNDIFFDIHKYEIAKDKVYNYFNLQKDNRIVIYAPTFRGNHSSLDHKVTYDLLSSLNVEHTLEVLKERFRYKFLFLLRTHFVYRIQRDCSELENKNNILSASTYPDMQELLCAADILITDYSSSMWDFSLTYKPCFLYTPDVKVYTAKRGFYTPIEEWPFPLAETNEKLVENILNFNEEIYKQAIKKHHFDLGSYETGTATKQFCEKVFS